MSFSTKQEVLDILNMPQDEFESIIMPLAQRAYLEQDGRIIVRSVAGCDDGCENPCFDCGMYAPNKEVNHSWTPVEGIIEYGHQAKECGFSRILLAFGEDGEYSVDDICYFIHEIHEMGIEVTLAAGLFPRSVFEEMKAAGLDQYLLKFEMAQAEMFNRLNPFTTYKERMASIEAVKEADLKLATGDIVAYPGQTLEMLAEDILLTRSLEASWAPVIPFMLAKDASLSAEGGAANLEWLYKTISLLRLMIPEIDITAQQPGKDLSKGLADPESNLKAICAGANTLFCELPDPAKSKDFGNVDDRNVAGAEHIYAVHDMTDMEISF